MFRRTMFLWLALALLPTVASSQNPGIKQGDPAFYFDFPGGTISILRGESWCFDVYAMNYAWNSQTCPGTYDTFAVVSSDLLGWPITNTFVAYDQGTEGEDAEGTCYIINDDGVGPWYFVTEVCFTAPCEAIIGGLNTLTLQMVYCDGTMTAQPDSGDCEDPNMHSDIPRWSTITQDFEVIQSPPSLYILQDTLWFVDSRQAEGYVPFSICNGDPCAPPTDFDYMITNSDTEYPFEQTGTAVDVAGGTCEDVHAIVNGTLHLVCFFDTLTIIAWDAATGTEYDTCVQAIHVIEPCCVPIFKKPVTILLVLLLVATAAVLLRRRIRTRTSIIILAIALAAATFQGCGGEESLIEPEQQPDSQPVPFIGSDFQVDLNGDGMVDFVSDWLCYQTADVPSSGSMIAQLICPQGESRVQYAFPEGNQPLIDLTPVDEALGWIEYCAWPTSIHWSIESGWDSLWRGPWVGGPAMNLGVSIVIDGRIHYGWIKISVDSEFGTISVRDFAYQPIPGEGILAGVHPDPIDNGEYKDTGQVPEK